MSPDILVHLDSLQDESLNLGLDILPRGELDFSTFDCCAEQSAATSEPEEDEVVFAVREELNAHVQKACVAGTEENGCVGEAVNWGVGEACFEDGNLAVCVFVDWEGWVEGRVIGSSWLVGLVFGEGL